VEWTADKVEFLARKWDQRVRREVSRFERVVPEIEERGTVLREPASEEQVAAAEKRLGVRLPPSYRAFLLISNGAHASPLGAEKTHAGGPSRHGFLPVGDVAPAAEADAFTVELWTGLEALNEPKHDRRPTGREPVNVGYFQPLKRGLLVSRPLEVWRSVLVPRDGVEEWELWDMAKEETGAYRSFADFLWYQVHRPEWMPVPERADEYAAAVRLGRLGDLDRLAEIGDPRAGPLAAEWLESEQFEYEWERMTPAMVLSKLGDPAHIPALLRAYERATIGNYRITLMAALEAAGAPEARELIRAAAEDRDESVRRWATWKLSAREGP
jgi:hypothetical protein